MKTKHRYKDTPRLTGFRPSRREIRERLQHAEKRLAEEEAEYDADPLSINLHEVEAETEVNTLRWVLGK